MLTLPYSGSVMSGRCGWNTDLGPRGRAASRLGGVTMKLVEPHVKAANQQSATSLDHATTEEVALRHEES